ncbi:uncharacterized protein [Phyllobates terribilis]|uniref:uncharacterized protein n=1 Tax=Phyllobates terribilis TaxID=111132 RepID=UPI003CCA6E24
MSQYIQILWWSKELMDFGKELIKSALQDIEIEQMFAYDTTFNLGDFYMSTFVMRNTMLEKNPIFPVAFMVHERKFQKYHELFIGELVNQLNLKDIKTIPFVTDREKGILNAVKKVAQSISLVLCENHILRDIEYWVKSARGKNDDIKVLKDHVEQLKDSESEEEWRNKYEEFKILWSHSFAEYFEHNLHEHIFKFASRFYTKKFAAFQDKGSTNNVSESMNKILKNATDWKELSLDCLLLCLLHLQLFYVYEFQRAYYSLGMYHLKATFKKLQKVPNEYTQFPLYIPVEKIFEKVKSENSTIVPSLKKESTNRMTQTAIANLCIENNLVSLNGQLQVFVVKSPFKNDVHSVCLSRKPQCSCNSSGLFPFNCSPKGMWNFYPR